MGTMRTPETEAAYARVRDTKTAQDACPLCDDRASIKEFELWRIVENRFPYDKIAHVHHMLMPKRHASDTELTPEELTEFDAIKREYVQTRYEFMIEPVRSQRSIPGHAHLHLVIAKE